MLVLIMGTILQPLQTTSSHHTATVTTTVSSSPGFFRARSATPSGKMNECYIIEFALLLVPYSHVIPLANDR